MKIAILAAGYSKYFPIFIAKPKCLYHLNGEIQLKRVIENAKKIVDEKDIIVVGGYKYKYIQNFLKENYPKVELKVNHKYNGPAIYSFRTAIENVDDDVVFTFGDESISYKNLERIASSKRKLSILYHDNYYYYSLGIFKLRKDVLNIFDNDKYLLMDEIKKIYKFANNGKEYNGSFSINSGICIGYTMIDIVTTIGNITKIENPSGYTGEDIDFLHYDPKSEYVHDLDDIKDTDEYKNSALLRLYNNAFSRVIKKLLRLCRVNI